MSLLAALKVPDAPSTLQLPAGPLPSGQRQSGSNALEINRFAAATFPGTARSIPFKSESSTQGQNLFTEPVLNSISIPWALTIEMLHQLIYDKSLPDGSASNASISLRKRLAAYDPSAEALSKFFEKNPDPASWLCQKFPYLERSQIWQYSNPLGVSFHLDGPSYAKFVFKEGIRTSDLAPISLGVTLSLASIPQEYYNMFVIVNRGNRNDGTYGNRSAAETESTDLHEKAHSAFHRFFKLQRQLGLGEVEIRLGLMNLDDLNSHYNLAWQMALGNAEFARSEIISYAAQGITPERKWVVGDFQERYLKLIEQSLNNKNATNDQRQAVMSCYNGYFAGCEENVKQSQNKIHEIFGPAGPATLEEKLAHSLYYTSELKFQLHSLAAA